MQSDPVSGNEGVVHGGDLAAARRAFPAAPAPFIDLSTGINPHTYPIPPLDADIFHRLPGIAAAAALEAAAAACYGAPSDRCVVAAPGTQILLPRVASLVTPGRAVVLGPTYAEHAVAARRAGHAVTVTTDPAGLAGADLAILVNPNNPDGRLLPASTVVALAAAQRRRGGLLVVDEAFMDVCRPSQSVAAAVAEGGLVVLRSFGKFFGLAGLRLGFALAAPAIAARLRDDLGPWAVSGPALAIGTAALADEAWQAAMRLRLARDTVRLDGLLATAGFPPCGGTSLFRLIETDVADALHARLGAQGLWVRRFPDRHRLLRFGLPGDEVAWDRLARALA